MRPASGTPPAEETGSSIAIVLTNAAAGTIKPTSTRSLRIATPFTAEPRVCTDSEAT
jgi:hypothetical protein